MFHHRLPISGFAGAVDEIATVPPTPVKFEPSPVYDVAASANPLPWTQHWISSKGLQVAPQETEVESYVVGGIKQDVKKDTFTGFKL